MAPAQPEEENEESEEEEEEEDSEEESEEGSDEEGSEDEYDYGYCQEGDDDDYEVDLQNTNVSASILAILGHSAEEVARVRAAQTGAAADWKPPTQAGLNNSEVIAQRTSATSSRSPSSASLSGPEQTATAMPQQQQQLSSLLAAVAEAAPGTVVAAATVPAVGMPLGTGPAAPYSPPTAATTAAAAGTAPWMPLPMQSSSFLQQQQQQPIAFRIGTLQPVDLEKDKRAAALLPPAAAGGEESGEESEEDFEEDSDEDDSDGDEENWDTASMVSHSAYCVACSNTICCVVLAMHTPGFSSELTSVLTTCSDAHCCVAHVCTASVVTAYLLNGIACGAWSDTGSEVDFTSLSMSPNLLRLLGHEDKAASVEAALSAAAVGGAPAWVPPSFSGLANSSSITTLAPVRVAATQLEVKPVATTSTTGAAAAGGATATAATSAASSAAGGGDSAVSSVDGADGQGDEWDSSDEEGDYEYADVDDDTYLRQVWNTNVSDNLLRAMGGTLGSKTKQRYSVGGWQAPAKSGLSNSTRIVGAAAAVELTAVAEVTGTE
eukprot:7370-Heterococcus_DN1.PRE.1